VREPRQFRDGVCATQKRWGGAPKIDVNAAKKPEKKFFGLF